MIEFERALLMILSKTEEDRKKGEIFISSLEPQPDFYKFLLYGLGLTNESACLAGILFRQKYVESLRYQTLTISEQGEIKKYLFACIRNNQSLAYLKNLAVILVKIYKLEANLEDSYNFVLSCKELQLDHFTLFVVEVIVNYWQEFIEPTRQQLSALLWDKSESSDSQCQVLACKLMCDICPASQLSSSQVTDRILQVLKLNSTSTDLTGLLDSILTTYRQNPVFLSNHLAEFTQILINLSSNPVSGHLNKVASIEVLLKLNKTALSLNTLQDLLVFAFKLTSDLENFSDINAWAADVLDLNAVNNDNLSLGKDLLCALLEDPRTSSSYLQLAFAHLRTTHWVHQHTAALAFGYYCMNYGEFLQEYKDVVALINVQNPRIQWAVLSSICCFAYKFPSEMKFGCDLWVFMADFIQSPYLALQVQALQTAMCLLQVSNTNIELSNSQSLSLFYNKVFQVLNNPQLPEVVLNNLFELISFMPETHPALFSQFQEYFHQGLEKLLKSQLPPSTKAPGIKCFVLIACNESFQFAENCCQLLLQMMGTDDCIDNAIIECCPILFDSLKERFYPFGNFLVNIVLQNAKMNIKSGVNEQGVTLFASYLTNDGNSEQWGLCAEELNKKIIACKTLMRLSKLGPIFGPYAEEAFKVAEELTNYKQNKKIKLYAKKTVKALSSLNRDVLVS